MIGVDSMDGEGTLYTGGGTTVTVYERRGKTLIEGEMTVYKEIRQYIRRDR